MSEIKKRLALREDYVSKNYDLEPKVYQCIMCKCCFEVSTNHEQKLSEEATREWLKSENDPIVKDKKSNTIYPNLKEETPFQCEACKGLPNCNTDFEIKKKYLLYFGTMVLVAFLVAFFTSNFILRSKATPFEVNVHDQLPSEKQLDENVLKLEHAYKNQDKEIWPIIISGIKAVSKYEPNQPAVILMIYSDKKAGEIAYCLAKDLSKMALSYLSIRSSGPIELTGKDLDSDYFKIDSGRVLEKYKNSIRTKGAMILTDLQDVPPEVAKSFHFMCDKFTPLVERAVYFFILRIDNVPKDYIQWSRTAEETLKYLWDKDLVDEQLTPLITRMSPSSIAIFPDDSVNC